MQPAINLKFPEMWVFHGLLSLIFMLSASGATLTAEEKQRRELFLRSQKSRIDHSQTHRTLPSKPRQGATTASNRKPANTRITPPGSQSLQRPSNHPPRRSPYPQAARKQIQQCPRATPRIPDFINSDAVKTDPAPDTSQNDKAATKPCRVFKNKPSSHRQKGNKPPRGHPFSY